MDLGGDERVWRRVVWFGCCYCPAKLGLRVCIPGPRCVVGCSTARIPFLPLSELPSLLPLQRTSEPRTHRRVLDLFRVARVQTPCGGAVRGRVCTGPFVLW